MIPDFNTIDIVVLVILAISAAVGVSRGFTREVLGIAGWIGAFFISLYGMILVRPYVMKHIHDAFVADIISGVTLFIVALIVLTIISRKLSLRIKSGALGGLDRSLGVVFGVIRGGVLLSLAYLVFSFFMPNYEKWPKPMLSARSTPYIVEAGDWLRGLVPQDAIKNFGLKKDKLKARMKPSEFPADNLVRSLSRPAPEGPKTDKQMNDMPGNMGTEN